ncbi:MAG TPA: low molecular weight protein-tyrosine-phosphatase [Polyangiaceae bacterium]|jgi:protein-tyrosine phosphatase|nr:low molecular weight protein-tyrosine-phosphatase [Polyangiaceae bacterium]
MVSVCFVCLGNICRSPTAAGVMRQLVLQAGLESHIVVDSAGTSGYHIGDPPDRRARAAALARRIDISHHARQFKRADFARFQYVLAMDADNLDDLNELARGLELPGRLALLRSFDREAPPQAAVPDPYYGGEDGFEHVLDLCTAACKGLLEVIRREHGL